ncbi:MULTISPECIES: hypothetical protein [unclassified Leptolyngbya]|uniref:hypothetical protein n=1 Tax=unclassified Leptolyngbya TaxID=2650499 RepID=UPI001682348F|nr:MULTISPECIES: hypothetical protein [unclassified Leptolyngbya]MBD1912859.1 hypothetical protein [Leptolyngbya sp. FACHB-8]MBD2153968.1 hypothetical protein [Leptolyngbya sp. FACHB-16]
MLTNEAEIKLQARMIAARSPLSADEAECLIRFTDEDTKLLEQCEELAKRSVSFASITQWLEGKIGRVEPGSQAYTFCEAVLNLVSKRERQR